MTPIEMMLSHHVRSIEFFAMDPRHSHVERFILRHGRVRRGRTLPREYRYGPQKQCFMNADQLADRNTRDLIYVEGYATRSDLPIPFKHAWCEDKDGGVVDPTWRNVCKKDYYMGVQVTHAVRRMVTLRSKTYGVLWSGPFETPNFEFIDRLAETLEAGRAIQNVAATAY